MCGRRERHKGQNNLNMRADRQKESKRNIKVGVVQEDSDGPRAGAVAGEWHGRQTVLFQLHQYFDDIT